MKEFLYVDFSNLLLEGRRLNLSRRTRSRDTIDARDQGRPSSDFRIDFRALYAFLVGKGNKLARAVMFGSQAHDLEGVWSVARTEGFETVITTRNPGRGEKGVDTGLVTRMLTDVLRVPEASTVIVTVVTGDADFVPPLLQLSEIGVKTEVAFWSHATARTLISACDRFIPLDPYLDTLKWDPSSRCAGDPATLASRSAMSSS